MYQLDIQNRKVSEGCELVLDSLMNRTVLRSIPPFSHSGRG